MSRRIASSSAGIIVTVSVVSRSKDWAPQSPCNVIRRENQLFGKRTLPLEVERTHCVARKLTDQRVKVIATHPWHICETKDDAINIWRESVDDAVNGASNPHAVILVVHKIYGAVSKS